MRLNDAAARSIADSNYDMQDLENSACIGRINPVFGVFDFYCGMGDVSAGLGIGVQSRQGE
jgi:hypothetical protein